MKHSKLFVLSFLLVVFIVSTSNVFAFYRPVPWAPGDMSVIVRSRTLDDEQLVEGDEIGVFSQLDVCIGASVVEVVWDPDNWEETQLGISCPPDDPDTDQIEGFRAGVDTEMFFRVWDESAGEEFDYRADIEVILGEAEFSRLGFLICHVIAERRFDPEIRVRPPEIIDFGNVQVDDDPGVDTLWIFNDGQGDLVVSDIVVEDGVFDSNFEGQFTLEFNDSLDFIVTFDPDQEGEFEGTLTIVWNNPDDGDYVVDLQGVSLPPSPRISTSADTIDFEEVEVPNYSNERFFIYSDGEEALIIDGISIDDGAFTTSLDERLAEGPIELDPADGEDDQLCVVTFAPDEVREYGVDMTIHSNATNADGDGNVFVHLKGEGMATRGGHHPTQHFFGRVLVDNEAVWRMGFWNNSDVDYVVYSIESTNEAFTVDFNVDSLRVRPGDELFIDVAFTPPEVLFYDGELHIDSNDPPQDAEYSICYLGGQGWPGAEGHFVYFPTSADVSHSMYVVSTTLQGEALVEGDEIGVFTPAGMCAGAGSVDGNGEAGFAAWGDDDPDDNIINGFVDNEGLSFMVWDADAEVEAWAVPEYLNGPEVFTPHGVTRLNLAAEPGELQPHIWISDYINHYGQVDYDDHMTEDWHFIVENRGPGDLVVSSITSDLEVFTFVDYEGGEFTLTQGQSDTIWVRFAPDDSVHFVGRLTLRSNDPDDPVILLDVDGYGVPEVIEPDIELSVNNYFFGVQHINDNGWPGGPYEFVLSITNSGGGELRVDSVNHEGSEVFASDFDHEQVIRPNESYELTLTFDPEEVRRYDAMFIIYSDDPDGDDVIRFPVRGVGSDANDYFLHHVTPSSHSIIVQRAYLQLPDNGGEVDLSAGDEVAVFTPAGLCVGHVILASDEDIGLEAYANDPDNNIDDGFQFGEEMTFKFWDWTFPGVLEPVTIDWIGGPQTFEINGETTVELSAEIDELERQVGSDPECWDYGPVHIDTGAEQTIRIFNAGAQTLVISDVVPNDETLGCDWDQEEVSLEAGEGFDLTVTFTPAEPLAYPDNQIIIHSNDPDEPEFGIYMTGTGSEAAGHYEYYQGPADQNHSILVILTMSDIRAPIYDEVGAFNGTGICCGSKFVDDPEVLLGVTASNDDAGTDFLVEGFESGEDIYFHIWDHSQSHEYVWEGEDNDSVEVDIEVGQLRFAENGLTRISLNIPNVFVVIPVDNKEVDEGQTVEFDIEWVNPPAEDMAIRFENPDIIDGLGEHTLEGNTFNWVPNFDAGRQDPYELEFLVYNPDNEDECDRLTVIVQVNHVNQDPNVVGGVRDEIFAWDAENEAWTFTIEEDAGWVMVIPDLREFYIDPDGDELMFWERMINGLDQEIRGEDEEDPFSYWVNVQEEHWFGRFENCAVTADERGDNRDANVRILRRIDGAVVNERMSSRMLRTTSGEMPSLDPRRDETPFEFDLIVTSVNDIPLIEDEGGNELAETIEYAVNEGEELTFTYIGDDIEDAPEDLVWTHDRDELPDGYEFVDNNDGSMTFTWTPTFEDARFDDEGNPIPYDPVFTLTDTEGGTDQITAYITVGDVNRGPIIPNPIADMELPEDSDAVQVPLVDVFSDPDGDLLTLTLVDPPDDLGLEIVMGNLVIHPIANLNTHGTDPFTIIIRATDDADIPAFVDDEFLLTIYDLNDPPDPFALLAPDAGFTVTDDVEELTFQWEDATPADNPWEPDAVYYIFVLRDQEFPDDSVAIPMMDMTEFAVTKQGILDTLEFEEHQIFKTLEWYVRAIDDSMAFVDATDSPRVLNLVLVVEDQYGPAIPNVYFLSPSFPNPFNARTTVRFGLPTPGATSVTVWDMHGRRVADLTSGHHSAGRYSVVWDAQSVTSGVYIIKLESGSFKAMQKAVLLR